MAKTAAHSETQPQTETQPQNILWVVPDKPDDISTGRQQIAQRLRNRGHAVSLVSDRKKALVEARNGYDVIVGTTAWLGAVAAVTNATVVVDYVDPIDQLERSCGRLERTAAYALHRNALRQADGVLYVYDRVAGELPPDTPTVKTSLGVDYERFADPDPRAEDAATAKLASAGVTGDFAVYIGGLEPTYRIETLCSAFAGEDIQLVIAGAGSKQEFVTQQATAHDNINYLGCIDHATVPGLLAQASAGLALVNDAHTVKVLEYAAAGVPIVHIDGVAKQRYKSVWWCQNTPESVLDATQAAIDSTAPPAMARFAKRHDYRRVVDDYAQLVGRVA